MSIGELLLLSVGLAMDAFAVSVCKGLSIRKIRFGHALTVGLYFGFFQALMPLVGYLLGVSFSSLIQDVDHWVAFVLLALIGLNMIRESGNRGKESEDCAANPDAASLDIRVMLMLALATSIDALTVGITFAFLKVPILLAVGLIGGITCGISMAGVWIGHRFGKRFQAGAERLGGVILILMGLKILLEHLGVFA